MTGKDRPMRHILSSAAFVGLVLGAVAVHAGSANPLKDEGSWPDIRADIVDAPDNLLPGDGILVLEAPERAYDAAIVPVAITQSGPDRITGLTLVIDENPAPLAAHFDFGPAMGPLEFETRVRVDQYSNLRAIASLETGDEVMTGRFVKASGGCSAPASKDADLAARTMGQMKVKMFQPGEDGRAEAQVMIRHPNYSGLQRNQITQLFVPANFLHELEVTQGDVMLFRMEGGISISENPTFRFKYDDDGSGTLRVRAVDTDGNVYQEDFGTALL